MNWIFCMSTEYFCMLTEYLVCVLNILYVYWISCMCTKYFVCILNILYEYWIFCVLTEYLVFVLNILYFYKVSCTCKFQACMLTSCQSLSLKIPRIISNLLNILHILFLYWMSFIYTDYLKLVLDIFYWI